MKSAQLKRRKKERKLSNRRKRASKGRLIRISDLVFTTLDEKRRQQSWDCLLRRQLGLPDRNGVPQPLIEGMLETMTGMFLLKVEGITWEELEETAYKMAHKVAAKRATKRISWPVRLREAV